MRNLLLLSRSGRLSLRGGGPEALPGLRGRTAPKTGADPGMMTAGAEKHALRDPGMSGAAHGGGAGRGFGTGETIGEMTGGTTAGMTTAKSVAMILGPRGGMTGRMTGKTSAGIVVRLVLG